MLSLHNVNCYQQDYASVSFRFSWLFSTLVTPLSIPTAMLLLLLLLLVCGSLQAVAAVADSRSTSRQKQRTSLDWYISDVYHGARETPRTEPVMVKLSSGRCRHGRYGHGSFTPFVGLTLAVLLLELGFAQVVDNTCTVRVAEHVDRCTDAVTALHSHIHNTQSEPSWCRSTPHQNSKALRGRYKAGQHLAHDN